MKIHSLFSGSHAKKKASSSKENLKQSAKTRTNLYKKLDQVGKFITSMEEKKVQSEQLNVGVDGIVRTLEEHVQGSTAGPLKALSLLEVAGVDRSNIEDSSELSSKEKVIVNLIEALKRNLILEDKQRRNKEHLYQKKLDALFKEVRQLKSAMAEEKTSNDGINSEDDFDDQGNDSFHVGEPVTGTQRSSPYPVAPTKSSFSKRHKKTRHHHRRRQHHHYHLQPYEKTIKDEDISHSPVFGAAQITPSDASVAQMYRGILDSEMKKVETSTSVNPMMEEGAFGFDKSPTEKQQTVNTLSQSDKQHQQIVNQMNSNMSLSLDDPEHNVADESSIKNHRLKMDQMDLAILKDSEKVNIEQQRLVGSEMKPVHQQFTNELDSNHQQPELTNKQNSSGKQHDEVIKDARTEKLLKNVASTDVPFVRLVKEEHKMKQNVQPALEDSETFVNNNNKTNNEDGKQTVVNFRTDDLKALEDNLFAAFEKKIRSKEFDGTIESLRKSNEQDTGLTRHLNDQSVQDHDTDAEPLKTKEEIKTVITPQSFLENLRDNDERRENGQTTTEQLLNSKENNAIKASNINEEKETFKDIKPQTLLKASRDEDGSRVGSKENREYNNITYNKITDEPLMYQMNKEKEDQHINQNMITVKFFHGPDSQTNKNGQFLDEGERANYIDTYKGILDKQEDDLDSVFSRKAVLKYSKPDADSDAHFWLTKSKGKTADGILEDAKHPVEQNGVQTGFVRSQGQGKNLNGLQRKDNNEKLLISVEHLPLDEPPQSIDTKSSTNLVDSTSSPSLEKAVTDRTSNSLLGTNDPGLLEKTTYQLPKDRSHYLIQTSNKPNGPFEDNVHRVLEAEPNSLMSVTKYKPLSKVDEVPEGRYLIPVSKKKSYKDEPQVMPSEGLASFVSSPTQLLPFDAPNNKGLDGQYLIKIR